MSYASSRYEHIKRLRLQTALRQHDEMCRRHELMRVFEDANREADDQPLESIGYHQGWFRIKYVGWRIVVNVREDDLKRRIRILEAKAHEKKYPAPLDTDD